MSPADLVLRTHPNHHFQNRLDKRPSQSIDSLKERRDDNIHHSISNGDSSNGGSSHQFSGFSNSIGQNGGSGSNKNSGFSFSNGNNRNGGFNFDNGSGNGGSGIGGSGIGGSGSGGSGIGGSGSGGSANGGSASGGSASGGSASGGSANGGSANGGSANGGSANDSNSSDNTGHGSSDSNNGDHNNSNNSNSGSQVDGSNNNNAGGGVTQTVTTTFSISASTSPSSFPSPAFTSSTGEDNLPLSTVLMTSSTDSVSPDPTFTPGELPPTEQLAIRHVSLPLGSIVAIILGILFCIAIGGVIYVVTRPKFGSLGRLWRHSKVSSSYLPSIASYEPKEIRDSSNLYRPYQPQDLSSFRFGTAGLNATPQGYNETSSRGFDNLQTQIYSTRVPGSSSPKAQRSVTNLRSETEDDSIESLTRIMSMMDRYPFERNSSVDSGQISPNPSDLLPLNDTHYRRSDYARSMGPETTSGK